MTGQTYGNGVRASMAYDAASRMTTLTYLNSGGTTLASFGYQRDKVGNPTSSLEIGSGLVGWVYDKVYQLVNERRGGTGAYNISHTWDPVGNQLVKTDGGAASTMTYDAANQLQTSVSRRDDKLLLQQDGQHDRPTAAERLADELLLDGRESAGQRALAGWRDQHDAV